MSAVWYRIDRQTESVQIVGYQAVKRAAEAITTDPQTLLRSGRFVTATAVFSKTDRLTADEWARLAGVPRKR